MTGTEEDMTTEDGDCSRLLYSSKKSACQAAYALHKASPPDATVVPERS